jgi:hypothetical protein
MLFEMISKGLKTMESRTGDTIPELTTVLLICFFILVLMRGLADGIDIEFLLHGLKE